jgi:hypothetical protein
MPKHPAPRVRLVIANPRQELSDRELRELFLRYFEAQTEIDEHVKGIAGLKAERSNIVKTIVEDRGVATFEFKDDAGVVHTLAPVQYGTQYLFQEPTPAELQV